MADLISSSRLREIVHYDPATGVFTNLLQRAAKPLVGDRVGTIKKSGYRYCELDGKRYGEHRLAWFYMTGEWPLAKHHIDHDNGIRFDNRWNNLRLATPKENQQNRKTASHNLSGLKGVSKFSQPLLAKPYFARIKVATGYRFLGTFETAEEAHAAYISAARENFGSFARTA